MRIFSQNLINFDIPIPDGSILRINLAWINSLDDLRVILKKHANSKIFLDLPIGRTKPPNNKYSVDDLITILDSNKNICYFAISNVNSSDDLKQFIDKIPKHVTLVPKIESPDGIHNIENIISVLGDEKVIMLDHDDLFSNLIKKNEDPKKFKEYVATLTNFCKTNNVIMLRTIGVIFSDEETRITQYMK